LGGESLDGGYGWFDPTTLADGSIESDNAPITLTWTGSSLVPIGPHAFFVWGGVYPGDGKHHNEASKEGAIFAVESPAPAPSTTTPTTQQLEPPDAANPAAGACEPSSGAVATVSVGSADNVPSPRCAIVRDNQRVRVVNVGATTLDVTIGKHFQANVPAHGEYTFRDAVDAYLAHGVHYLVF